MDVFLSYANADKAFARQLARDLTQEGLSVWFDENEIKPGSNIVASMLNALKSTRIFMPLISDKTSTSPWFASEIAAALAASEASEDRRIVPVRIERGAEIPPFLRQFSSVDLSDAAKYRESVSKLVGSLTDNNYDRSLPPPNILKQYNEIIPDFSINVMKMTEAQNDHRRKLEREAIFIRNIGYVAGASTLLTIAFSFLIISTKLSLDIHLLSFMLGIFTSSGVLFLGTALRSILRKRNGN